MDESEARVEMAVGFESEADKLVANRILESPDAYRRWEAEHDHLLRAVSEQAHLSRQVVMLRSAACALVHRKALFEYLRDCQVRGARRHRLFALFYGFPRLHQCRARGARQLRALQFELSVYELSRRASDARRGA